MLTPKACEYDGVFNVLLVPDRAGEQVAIGNEQMTVPRLSKEELQCIGQLALGMSHTEIVRFGSPERTLRTFGGQLKECGFQMGLNEVFPKVNDCSLVHRAFCLGLLRIGADYDPQRWPTEELSNDERYHLALAACGLGLKGASASLPCSLTTTVDARKSIRTKLNVPSLPVAITAGHYLGLL